MKAPTVALSDLVKVIRSKNAGPTRLTLDLFFRDQSSYNKAIGHQALQSAAIALLYGVQASQVQRFELPDLLAIKLSLPRRRCAGDPGDGDVYGAQQHAGLLGVAL